MCTNILLKSKNGDAVISARTMDFGGDFITKLHKIPRSEKYYDILFNNETEFTKFKKEFEITEWENAYGYLSTHAYFKVEKWEFEIPTCMDGMNEKGLSGATLWMPCADYPKPNITKKNILSIHLVAYILATCATVNDVVDKLEGVNVINFSTSLNKFIPQHFVFSDSKGKSLIVEFKGGKMITHQPTNGVLTNYPFYDKQLINLKKYDDLTFENKEYTYCENDSSKCSQDTNGSGMSGKIEHNGLPGDATPKSRFVRASKFSEVNFEATNSQDAVTHIQQLIQTLQVPVGTIVPNKNNCGNKNENKNKWDMKNGYDHTKWCVIREHNSFGKINYYYYTNDNPTLQKISLDKIDWEKDSNPIDFEANNKTWYAETNFSS
ncbi:hypothetical protein CXF68_01210 [Tenacibaculum sp. Bg11-29]|uniref:linear amide C-N hydrolase n=1 Tax=Tenacibaculum sp. Bg11-29 TaxID=2058306 RepID=UPI000C3240C1|nr:linear amide C-N hydrolase [Tenacibaculum sp. Bg11-29]PKH49387.1 hypothetical protein CXF68_01210 [Tenacibaculum sp. Bg11-29]